MLTIIGITGRAGAGKSTLAEQLMSICEQAGVTAARYALAGPIKQLAREWFDWDGEKDARGRRLLQVLGTEAGRAYDPDLWVKKMEDLADEMKRARPRAVLVIDDVRFANEAAWIRAHGGTVWRVSGRDVALGEAAGHASEAGLPTDLIDVEIVNTADIAPLKVQALRWLPEVWARTQVLDAWGAVLDTDRLFVQVTT